MTGLTDGQLAELTTRVRAIHGDFHSNGSAGSQRKLSARRQV
jgi:hypothetical protein